MCLIPLIIIRWLLCWLVVGGWATPLKNDGVRQLGWFFPIYYGNIKHVPNHQRVTMELMSFLDIIGNHWIFLLIIGNPMGNQWKTHGFLVWTSTNAGCSDGFSIWKRMAEAQGHLSTRSLYRGHRKIKFYPSNGYGSKLGTPKLWMVNTKLD